MRNRSAIFVMSIAIVAVFLILEGNLTHAQSTTSTINASTTIAATTTGKNAIGSSSEASSVLYVYTNFYGITATSAPKSFPVLTSTRPMPSSTQLLGSDIVLSGSSSNTLQTIFGPVSFISGNRITLIEGSTTYTVDASKATIEKNNISSSIAFVAIGDSINVRGTVSGTMVFASSIIDGYAPQVGVPYATPPSSVSSSSSVAGSNSAGGGFFGWLKRIWAAIVHWF